MPLPTKPELDAARLAIDGEGLPCMTMTGVPFIVAGVLCCMCGVDIPITGVP